MAVLADGRRVALRKYQAAVTWNGRNREILVLSAEGGVLVGMAMLRGHRLTGETVADGLVTIDSMFDPAED